MASALEQKLSAAENKCNKSTAVVTGAASDAKQAVKAHSAAKAQAVAARTAYHAALAELKDAEVAEKAMKITLAEAEATKSADRQRYRDVKARHEQVMLALGLIHGKCGTLSVRILN